MRQFKFRIFDNREGLKRMTYPTGFYYYGDGFEVGNPKHKFVHANYPQGAFSTFHVNDIIIMQFTGLLDKNGKDIYEGDIMEFLDENWLVIYFEQYASFMLQKGNDLANITTQEEKIGNVYESPDLLK